MTAFTRFSHGRCFPAGGGWSLQEVGEPMNDPNTSWLLPFLALLRKRPPMFLYGEERVESLSIYLAAYRQARGDLGFKRMTSEDAELLENFTTWLRSKLNHRGNAGWTALVLMVDSGPRNVRTFFRLLEEFLATTGRSLETIEPSHSSESVTWAGG